MLHKVGDIWYRYYDGQNCIALSEYTVMKVTAKCVYLYESPGEASYNDECIKRWCKRVLQDTRRRYAYPTKELAANSYRIRKSFQQAYLTAQIEKLKLMESLMGISGDIPAKSLEEPNSLNIFTFGEEK